VVGRKYHRGRQRNQQVLPAILEDWTPVAISTGLFHSNNCDVACVRLEA